MIKYWLFIVNLLMKSAQYKYSEPFFNNVGFMFYHLLSFVKINILMRITEFKV